MTHKLFKMCLGSLPPYSKFTSRKPLCVSCNHKNTHIPSIHPSFNSSHTRLCRSHNLTLHPRTPPRLARHIPRASPTALLSPISLPLTSPISTTTATLLSYISQSIDPVVFASTATASFKLFIICTAVGYLLKTNRLPNSTASVLSQVSFQLLIPCMLFSKVATTVAAQADSTLMLGMACGALIQVAIGMLWGTILSPIVDGRYPKSFTVFGWHPMAPSKPAAAIASATAAATGVPLAATALLPRPAPVPAGVRELVSVACTYGNSFTLPCVFFLSLLPPVLADKAIAYAALFLLAWSPCLWSFGLSTVQSGFRGKKEENGDVKSESDNEYAGQQGNSATQAGNILNFGANNTAITPLLRNDGPSTRNKPELLKKDFLSPIFKSIQLFLINIKPKFEEFTKNALNPPIVSIICGLLVGITPLGKQLLASVTNNPDILTNMSLQGIHPDIYAHSLLPLELSLAWSALKCTFEVIEMLANGTLAMQTLVLAASLLQRQEHRADNGSTVGAAAQSLTTLDAPQQQTQPTSILSLWKSLLPSSPLEARAIAVLSLARFFFVPVSCLLSYRWLSSTILQYSSGNFAGLASVASDSIFLFVLAVQAVMPSAQNLLIVLQLSKESSSAAPGFARLLLKLYACSILPVTLWVTAFASRLAIPLT